MILGSKTTKNDSFFCDRTRSDQDENRDENGDDDWDDTRMMRSATRMTARPSSGHPIRTDPKTDARNGPTGMKPG